MKLYLVRHAQSIDNKDTRVSLDDSPLSEEGKQQTRRLCDFFVDMDLAAIYTSPFQRTRETAKAIALLKGVKIIESKAIIEKKDASSFAGKRKEDLPWDIIKKNRKNPDWRYEDGESFNDVKARVVAILAELEKYESDVNILMVSHHSFIKHLVGYVLLGDKFIPENYCSVTDRLVTKNTGITVLERKQKYYESKPSWYLLTWMV